MTNHQSPPPRLFSRGSFLESSRVAEILRAETTGGLLLIAGAAVALVWANTPLGRTPTPTSETSGSGRRSLHLDLTLGTWAADGLLAIFFFVAGLELKREFVAGDLRDPRRAALPVAAAVGGMVAPALIFVAWNLCGGGLRGLGHPDGDRHRVRGRDPGRDQHPSADRPAHVPAHPRGRRRPARHHDHRDLLHRGPAAAVLAARAASRSRLFAVLVQRRIRSPWLLVPLALAAWALVHESGVHATVAGVLLGFTVPVFRSDGQEGRGLAEHFEHLVRPISAGVAVPVFAFFAAGVTVGGWSGLVDALSDPVALGIITGLVVGKTIGISGSTWLLAKFTRAELDDELSWVDVIGMSMLAGIGFTVSLLIGELAFGAGQRARRAREGRRARRLRHRCAAGLDRAPAPQPGLPPDSRDRVC